MRFWVHLFFFLICFSFVSCQAKKSKVYQAAHIFRKQEEKQIDFSHPKSLPPPYYPWAENEGKYPPITKEHFRCKGSPAHLTRKIEREGRPSIEIPDCEGGDCHSLPLKEGKEYIYPSLIQILNYLQQEFETKVIITTGHRCPTHNRYCDSSSYNWNSKHMVGAEVDFYLEGLESDPLTVIQALQKFYSAYPPSFQQFKRFEAHKLNTSTEGWYNEEIFVKLYLENEGRDFDNRHSFPYISIQMRSFEGKRVQFDESLANNYLRD